MNCFMVLMSMESLVASALATGVRMMQCCEAQSGWYHRSVLKYMGHWGSGLET